MAYPIVRFVEEPAASPTTVLDLNGDGNAHLMHEDFSLGAPEWTAEPETVSGDDGYREFSAMVCVHRSYSDAAETISALSRVLQQPTSWLMVQREAAHPVMFLKTYRTPPEALNWEAAYGDTYRLPLTLTCDPYLYGEPITLPSFEIRNDPAATGGLNPAFVRFPVSTFIGDAPAPLKVDLVPNADWHGFQPLMASAALAPGEDQTTPYWYDLTVANGWVAGSATGADVADAVTAVGGSYRVFTATGTSFSTRLTGTLDAPPPGTYKVLLRCAAVTSPVTPLDSTFNVRLGQTYNVTQTRFGDTKTIIRPDDTLIHTYYCWCDLGEFTFPFGAAGLDASDIGGVTDPTVVIQAQLTDPVGPTLRLDALLLVPIETAATIDAVTQVSRFHGFGLETDRSGVWDGQRQRFLSYDFGVNLANLRPPELRGGWLRVTPGAVNVMHLLQQTQIATPAFLDLDDSDKIAGDATITLSYMPRWLHLRTDPA